MNNNFVKNSEEILRRFLPNVTWLKKNEKQKMNCETKSKTLP